MYSRILESIDINGGRDIGTKSVNIDWNRKILLSSLLVRYFSTYNLYTESPSSSVPESEFIDLMEPLRENEGCGTSKRKCDASSPLCS